MHTYTHTHTHTHIYIYIYLSIINLRNVILISVFLSVTKRYTICNALLLRDGWRNWPQSFSKWQIWSRTSHWNHLEFLISIRNVRNVLQSQEVFLKDDQKYFFKFWRKIEVLYIKLYVFCETNPMDWSKTLMDVILEIRNVLQASGRFLIIHHHEHLFEGHMSVVYQMLCIFKDKTIYGVSFNQGCHPYYVDQEHSWSSSIRKVLDEIFFEEPMSVIYQIVCIFHGKSIGRVEKFQIFQISKIPKFQNSINWTKFTKLKKNIKIKSLNN